MGVFYWKLTKQTTERINIITNIIALTVLEIKEVFKIISLCFSQEGNNVVFRLI